MNMKINEMQSLRCIRLFEQTSRIRVIPLIWLLRLKHVWKSKLTHKSWQFRTEQTKIEDNNKVAVLTSLFLKTFRGRPSYTVSLFGLKSKISKVLDAAESWKDLMPSMTAVDQRTGHPIMDMDRLLIRLPLVINGKARLQLVSILLTVKVKLLVFWLRLLKIVIEPG